MFNSPVLTDTVPHSAPYAPYLVEACARYGINTWLRQIHFLAQVAHESAGFTRVVESLNYRTDALIALFGRHRITIEEAYQYGRRAGQKADQRAIGNILYGGEWGKVNLGNVLPGDGFAFRGRGLIQTTGRTNYYSTSIGLFSSDLLLEDPSQLENPRWAALAAGHFWKSRNLNELADEDDIVGITKRINGGIKGLGGTGGRRWWLSHLKLEL